MKYEFVVFRRADVEAIAAGLKLISGDNGTECSSPRAKAAELSTLIASSRGVVVTDEMVNRCAKVPEQMTADSALGVARMGYVGAYMNGWNACRSAMLGDSHD